MKLIIKSLIILAVFIAPVNFVFAKEAQVNIYLFSGDGCPHCANEKVFLEKLKQEYPDLIINEFEVYYNSDNQVLMKKVAEEMGLSVSGVPLTIIGDQSVRGFLDEATTGQEIRGMVKDCKEAGCFDIVNQIINPEEPKEYNFKYADINGVDLDDETAIKGYTMNLFDSSFLFGITPNLLTGGGRFEFKEVVLLPENGMDFPDGYSLASKILEFDIKAKEKYDPSKPFWLQIKYNDDALYEKSIFYFDQGKGEWIMIPSKVNLETGYIRAAFHLPFAKLAVLQNDGIMSIGVASWYAYKDCDCAASPDYPKGTRLKVTNLDNDKSVIVTVNDFGPERDIFPDRVIDLDVVAFEKISKKSLGLCNVKVEPIEPVELANSN